MTNFATINHCKKWWWTTILYIGNYVNSTEICLGHSWYLMVDMQLYLLSPFILYPIFRFKNYTKSVIAAILLIASSSVIYVFVIYLKNSFRVSLLYEKKLSKDSMTYTATHAKLDSWMMGILTGFLLYNTEGKVIKLSKTLLVLGWMLTGSFLLLVIFAQYPLQQINFNENPLVYDAMYDAFKRITWCFAITWIIIACQLNYGGIIKRFLSLSIWLPISKLSYCIYLVHVLIQLVFMASIRSPEYFSNFRAIFKFFGDFGISLVFSFILAVVFECPTIKIIKILMERKNKVACGV